MPVPTVHSAVFKFGTFLHRHLHMSSCLELVVDHWYQGLSKVLWCDEYHPHLSWEIAEFLFNVGGLFYCKRWGGPRGLCCVLGISEIGANCDFWVKTRYEILVKGSCIWANQVWPRAILTPSKWPKFKNVLAKSHKGDLPIGWDVFWLKAI